MIMQIRLEIPGIPVPKGSAKAFVSKGRAIVTQTNSAKQRPWASAITLAARDAMGGNPPVAGPCDVRVFFYMPRPKKHYRTGKHSAELRPDAPDRHSCTPDIDKLLRCVLDAMTGVVWRDDGQVYSVAGCKFYTGRPGVLIQVTQAKEAQS